MTPSIGLAVALAACEAPEALVRLDHAIVVVHDLDAAAARFAPLGFVLKPGRPHPDGLLNRHIKFRDGTEVELMTVAGKPTSRMARDYQELLAAGEGGVYAALWTDDIERVRKAAARVGAPRLTRLGPWSFLSLPGVPDTGGVFVGAGSAPANDPDSVLSHANGAQGLASVWVEGGPALDDVLTALGSRPCGPVRLPDGRTGTRWALARGSLVVVRSNGQRILGVELRRRDAAPPATHEPLRGFWVQLL
jgi:glyoxalase-like protein